jgi:putative intracellular protease/amidase
VNPVAITAQAGTVTETSTINLAAQVTVAYEVNLTWDAPAASSDPVVGYDAFRAPGGSSVYAQINSGPVTVTAFTDDAVVEGNTYDYLVEGVDAAGNNSVPSNMAAVAVP